MPDASVALYPPTITETDVMAVTDVLRSGWVSSGGEAVREFETALTEAMGLPYAVATSSGTSALQLALEALDVRGSDVLMPAMTFAAPASAIVRAEAHPVFVDLDPNHFQLDIDMLEQFLRTECRGEKASLTNIRSGRRIGAICAVHLYGSSTDLSALVEVANRFGLPVLHDAAQALGARWHGAPIGTALEVAATPHLLVTSFNANKIVTCGGGGAVLGHHRTLLDRLRHISSTAKSHPIAYRHDAYGLNVRLSSINAALGRSQLLRLVELVKQKRNVADEYARRLSRLGTASAIRHHPAAESNGWMNVVRIERDAPPLLDAVARLSALGIETRPIWTPLFDLDVYARFQRYPSDMPNTSLLGRTGLMLPSGAEVGPREITSVVTALERAI